MKELVVRLRASATRVDPYSKKTVPDWSAAPVESSLWAYVADAGTAEPLMPGRTPVDSDYTLLFDEDNVDLTELDRMRVRGDTCTVEGRPFAWRGAGTVTHLKLREG